MIRTVYIIAAFLFAWVQFYNTAVYSIYEFNKSQFIENYCENKDKPELKCNGKCHLSEQMIDITDNNSEPIVQFLPEILLFLPFDDLSIDEPTQKKIQSYPIYTSFTEEFFRKIEHPPRA